MWFVDILNSEQVVISQRGNLCIPGGDNVNRFLTWRRSISLFTVTTYSKRTIDNHAVHAALPSPARTAGG